MGSNKANEALRSVEGTVIGPASFVGGRIQGDEDLTVQGRVEGELQLSRALYVEVSGVVKANASVKSAVIAGVFVGNVTATDSVELTAEGRLVGDVRAPRLIVAEGAALRGRVEMGASPPSAEGARAARGAPAPGAQPRLAVPARAAPVPQPQVAPTGRTPAPAAPPRPPLMIRQTVAPAKPVPPPPPPAAGVSAGARPESRPAEVTRPAPPAPPQAVAATEAGRRRVLLKKKVR